MRYLRWAVTVLLGSAYAFPQSDTRVSKPFPSSGFLKHLTIESFGYTSSTSTTTSMPYDFHGLECPLCTPGPMNRVRQLLPPFGAKASMTFWHERLILFAGFGGVNAASSSIINPRTNPKLLLRSSPDNDDWILQRQIGAAVAVDPEKHLSFGISQGYLNDFGPSQKSWTTTTGNLNFSPSLFGEIGRGLKSLGKPSVHPSNK